MSAIAIQAEREAEAAAVLDRIERIVLWSHQFRLVFIRCDDPALEQTLRRRVNTRLAGHPVLEIELEGPIVSLLDEIVSRWNGIRPPAAVSVFGLARSLSEQRQASPVLGRLNHERDLLRQKIPVSLLIWLPDHALTDMAKGAPDFWAWRSALLEFPMIEVKPMPGAPKVFISSTAADLGEFREAARAAAIRAGFLPIMNEDWEAKDAPPLAECMERVDQTHLTVAIVAHRYGWVPQDQPGRKSITWLECERTEQAGKSLLVFVLDENAAWPEERREEFRLTRTAREGKFDLIPALAEEVERNAAGLAEFKSWLTANRIRNTFATREELERKVESALRSWLAENPGFQSQAKAQAKAQANPERYLGPLYESCAYIDIRGLRVGSGRAHRFPIEELYIELDTAGGGKLKNTLAHPRRVVVGDPGSGKTTFLRWIAHTLAGDRLGVTEHAAREHLGLARPLVPVFLSIAEWLEHIAAVRERKAASVPSTAKDPQWLVHFLGAQSESRGFGLDADWFRERLGAGDCLLLFDGLDEAPDRRTRELAVELLEAVSSAWKSCPMLVTTRPSGYQDRSVLPNFEPSHIEPLSDRAVENFLDRWSAALHPTDPSAAQAHRLELLLALNARPGIRRLARNTVMLTALAVVHWNEKRLPEQRAELYESILLWLARSREQRPGRAGAERSLEILRRLALAMQDAEGGRKVQVSRDWAATSIADSFQGNKAAAERFLEEEELDSGIVVRRGHEIRFWHLSFQEYLAARAIGGLSEERQRELLLGNKRRLYEPEWREVGQLLGGVLYEQGREKVDGLVRAVLGDLFGDGEQVKNSSLAEQARAAGLLGGIVRDLAPFRYEPDDPRYREVLDAALGIFDRERSRSVPVNIRIEAADALGQAGDPRLADESQRWIDIPGDRFLMGAQKDEPNAPNYDPKILDIDWYKPFFETPHWVEVDGFRIGRWPVTVQEYAEFIEDGGYAENRWWVPESFGRWDAPAGWQEQTEHPNRPITGVSWFEAMAFCAWLTEHLHHVRKLGEDRIIRLPTEAEWEWAARGAAARRFPWGNEHPAPELLNFGGNVGSPTPIGIYPLGATPEGVLDLAGNVWERCGDWFDENYYRACKARGTVSNPRGPEQGTSRVCRGGSWFNRSDLVRCACRFRYPPGSRNVDLGFRVVCSGVLPGSAC